MVYVEGPAFTNLVVIFILKMCGSAWIGDKNIDPEDRRCDEQALRAWLARIGEIVKTAYMDRANRTKPPPYDWEGNESKAAAIAATIFYMAKQRRLHNIKKEKTPAIAWARQDVLPEGNAKSFIRGKKLGCWITKNVSLQI
jgi:hypothetical protein